MKFRVWDKHLEMFFYESFLLDQHGNLYADTILLDPERHEINFRSGVTDKDGKDIYEGDVISYAHDHYEKNIRKVVFKSGIFGIELPSTRISWLEIYPLSSLRNVEVIGNIYSCCRGEWYKKLEEEQEK